mmetsp:Transcript_42107/g.69126  ORF Transcript_42107/g.69126 Transcript_42107/m.69126 type:complete len:201 (-) Transcript_42107:722-1324(-)
MLKKTGERATAARGNPPSSPPPHSQTHSVEVALPLPLEGVGLLLLRLPRQVPPLLREVQPLRLSAALQELVDELVAEEHQRRVRQRPGQVDPHPAVEPGHAFLPGDHAQGVPHPLVLEHPAGGLLAHACPRHHVRVCGQVGDQLRGRCHEHVLASLERNRIRVKCLASLRLVYPRIMLLQSLLNELISCELNAGLSHTPV